MQELYREQILDHFHNPRHTGHLTNATAQGEEWNPLCGDKLKLYIKIVGDTVTEVAWEGEGCAISKAAMSMLSEKMQGATLQALIAFT